MNKNTVITLSLMSIFYVTVLVAQECGTNEEYAFNTPFAMCKYNNFCWKFMEACNSYIAAVNMLPTREKHPKLPVMTGDLTITALRKVAVQFQDLRLRHDTLTHFTFNQQHSVQNIENMALQEIFINVQNKLRKIADRQEKIDINGWEICVDYSPQMIVLELRKGLEPIASYNGQFASILNQAITMVIDPYLLEYANMCQFGDNSPKQFNSIQKGFVLE